MKKIYCLLLLKPFFVIAADMPLAMNNYNMPEDFKNYFYHSAIPVKVLLNDFPLFDASVLLNENGHIELVDVIASAENNDPETEEKWRAALQSGITLGDCKKACPDGLMRSDYRLDSSELRLYSSSYESSRTVAKYAALPDKLPGGLIINNQFSAFSSGTSEQTWGLNSSWVASLFGWTQKLSFNSSRSSGAYGYQNNALSEFYSQKELQGSFVRLGFFAPDSDMGNTTNAGFGYDTVTGAMWGTSDALQQESDTVSVWPVYINGRNQSVAEVYRNGILIHTQQLKAGIQPLDTRRLPGGIYDISIRIIENGKLVDTQTAQIYKPNGWNSQRRWRANLWAGQQRTIASYSNSENQPTLAYGGNLDLLLHPRSVLSTGAQLSDNEKRLRLRHELTPSAKDTIFTQYIASLTNTSRSSTTDLRWAHAFTTGSNGSIFWRHDTNSRQNLYGSQETIKYSGNTWGANLYLRLPGSSTLTLNEQYNETNWRKGWSTDLSLRTRQTIGSQDVDFQVSGYNRPGYNNSRRDTGVAFSVAFSFAPEKNKHLLSADIGVKQQEGYTNLNYKWQPGNDSDISWLGGGVSVAEKSKSINGNGGLNNRYMRGDFFVQHNLGSSSTSSTIGGINIDQSLVVGGGHIASGNPGSTLHSAIIIDAEADDDTTLIATGGAAETKLAPGRNIISGAYWKEENLQFSGAGDDSIKIYPERKKVFMNKGSVQYIKVRAMKTQTLIGLLRDSQGNIVTNRKVVSDAAQAIVNAEGIITIEASLSAKSINVESDGSHPALRCSLPESRESQTGNVHFMDVINCKPADKL